MRYDDESIPDRSRPGLPTTSDVARQGTCGNYATAGLSENKRRKRGGRQVKRLRELWKGRRTLIRVGTLNIGTMTGSGRELADMMERWNIDILCLQEKSGKGVKRGTLEVAANYSTMELMEEWDTKSGGEELIENVLEVKRVPDRLMAMKLKVKGSILNIASAYATQVSNSMEERNDFWQDLDGLVESVLKQERTVLGADLNGHVSERNTGDEEIMGKYGAETRNKEGSILR